MTPSELRAAMERLGMSTTQLAIALRLGKGGDSTVRKWLRGDRPIPGPTQVTIEFLLDAHVTIKRLREHECTKGAKNDV